MNRHVFLPATKEGAGLALTFEQEQNYKLVYQKDETRDGRYIFAGLWNPEANYSDDYLLVPLRSVFGGMEDYPANQVFANIIGSTDDHRPSKYKSWLEVFRKNGIACDQCVTDGSFYDPDYTSPPLYEFCLSCGGGMVGGHVVADFYNASPARGARVYLLPICHNHNSCCTDGSGQNGSGFFMLAEYAGKVAVLDNYLQRPDE